MKTQIPQGYIDLLRQFISFKSISTDTQHSKHCEDTALWLEQLFKDAGFETRLDYGTTTNPLVLARYIHNPELETIMIYGHYDVQPASHEDGWNQNPFELEVTDTRLVARGAIDNKGQVLVHIYTVLEQIKNNSLHYNVIFMIEGNEESGNNDLGIQLQTHRDFIDADYVLISDGEIVKNRPTLEASFRGGSNITVFLQTAPNDFHSGIYGGAVPSASQTLVNILSTLKDENNQVLVPGFYDGVSVSQTEIERNKSLATTEEILELSGVKQLITKNGVDFYTQTGLYPTLEISGIQSGYTGVGYLNIVPAKAMAKINIRIVGNQDGNKIVQSIKDYITSKTPTYADISFDTKDHASSAIVLDIDSPKAKEVVSLLEQIYKTPIAIKNVGGSIPIVAQFRNDLGMNVLSVSLANEDCNMHGVSENFNIDILGKALAFSEAFFKKQP